MSTKFVTTRRVLATVLATITLLLSLLYTAGFYDSSLGIAAARGITLYALALGVAAFLLALKVRSPLVGGLLIWSGIVIWIPPCSAIISGKAILFPGPILGVVFFSPIFALGAAKLASTYWMAKNLTQRPSRRSLITLHQLISQQRVAQSRKCSRGRREKQTPVLVAIRGHGRIYRGFRFVRASHFFQGFP